MLKSNGIIRKETYLEKEPDRQTLEILWRITEEERKRGEIF
jgi:hypothetical protein